jgi:hypothetical protein
LFARPLSWPSRSCSSQDCRGVVQSSIVAAKTVSASSTSMSIVSFRALGRCRPGLHGHRRHTAAVPGVRLHKLVWFVPEQALEATRDAVFGAGAGRIGAYERCSWYAAGTGTFLAGEGADPAVGGVGEEERVTELRVETVVPVERAADVVRALVAAHPYEEVAYELYQLVELEP